jgi:hypothetical protein
MGGSLAGGNTNLSKSALFIINPSIFSTSWMTCCRFSFVELCLFTSLKFVLILLGKTACWHSTHTTTPWSSKCTNGYMVLWVGGNGFGSFPVDLALAGFNWIEPTLWFEWNWLGRMNMVTCLMELTLNKYILLFYGLTSLYLTFERVCCSLDAFWLISLIYGFSYRFLALYLRSLGRHLVAGRYPPRMDVRHSE